MSNEVDDDNNSYSSKNPIAIAGLSLALSYENAAVDRLDKRISESIVPEVKEKIKRHLEQTKGQQERLKERIKTLGGGMEPTSEKGQLPIPQPPHKLKLMIERQQFRERKRSLGIVKRFDNRTSRSYYVQRRNSSTRVAQDR